MSGATVTEWLNLVVRWIHVIAAIMWIGSSLFFNWLDARIEVNERTKARKIEGELWMVHSGGFYQVEKKLVAPEHMPEKLHWFKWEAGFTLLSGWLLLDIVYFQGGGVTLVDANVSSISAPAATALTVGLLVASWFVYDILWRVVPNMLIGAVATAAIVFGVLYYLTHTLSGRAAFLVTGAMMGTWMATNVWVHIIPAQQGLVRSVTEKKPPEEKLAKHAKTRSRHNNYFTYPVVLIMLSNHFSGAYGHKWNWAILTGLILVGATIRHLQNVYKEISPAILVSALVALALAAHSSLTSTTASSVDTGDPSTPLAATTPSSKGGPDKVPNESVVGNVKATIRLEGKPPPPKELNLGTCTADVKGPVYADTVLAKDGKLQNVFVWIKKGIDATKAPAAPQEPIVMDQKGCMYAPHVVGARVGQKIVFLNSDPVPHNVRTVLGEDTLFNEMMTTKGTRLTKVVDKEQVPARAKCDIHPWMSAFVGVVAHPWFAVSNDKGEIELVNVPEGDLEIEAWHEAYGRTSKPVKVKARDSVVVELAFRAE